MPWMERSRLNLPQLLICQTATSSHNSTMRQRLPLISLAKVNPKPPPVPHLGLSKGKETTENPNRRRANGRDTPSKRMTVQFQKRTELQLSTSVSHWPSPPSGRESQIQSLVHSSPSEAKPAITLAVERI